MAMENMAITLSWNQTPGYSNVLAKLKIGNSAENETHKNQASVVSTYSIAFLFTDSILSSSPRDFS
jgi:hypothetical protein